MKTARNGMIVTGGIFIIVMVFIVMGFTGCTPFKRLVNDNEFTMQLATEAATARVLHEHPKWTAKTISITTAAIAAIDSKSVTTLADIEAYIKGKVPWTTMLPEEQALVSALISEVRKNIEGSLRSRAIKTPELQLVEVAKVLTWIRDTAKRSTKS